MQSIIDAIEQWLKDFLIGAITGNLSSMFSDVNSKVATIATEVGKTPESWNSSVFSIILTLSKNVVVPIAGLVIAAVLTYELISMIIEKNNMHDIDTFMFFKWAFKSAAAAIIVNHTFDFIIAIFQVAQTMVQRSAGVIDTNASIDISSAIANITTELQATGLGDLFALMLETWVVSFAMKAMGLIITVILYGRMIEIYIYASVGPLPFATFMNREWGNIGTNYVRGLAALGLQGFLIMICVGIYAVLVNALSLGGIAGVGTYFLTRHSLGNDFALLLLIALAAPFMLFGLYEKNGQPLEKILKNIIRVRLLAPAARPYQTNNRFAALERQARYEKEVQQLVSIQNKATGKNSRGLGTSHDPARHQADRRRQKACGKGNPAGKKRG